MADIRLPSRRSLGVVLLFAIYGLAGLALIAFLAPSTFPGADLQIYQRAGQDLIQHGDPYYSAPLHPLTFQYPYPPLLAMLMPVLGWPPLWFGLMGGGTLFTFLVGLRQSGPAYLLPVVALGGAWGQVLLNGNVQPGLMALLAIVPLHRRAGAVGLAVATMVKVYPILGVLWYVARRDWVALRWFGGALLILLLVQAPWLPAFVRFHLVGELASPLSYLGFGLRAIHPVVWVVGAILVAIAAWRAAGTRFGWLLNVLLQLAVLPRLLLVNLALLLSAPIPARERTQTDA